MESPSFQDALDAAHQYLEGHACQLHSRGVEAMVQVEETSAVADRILEIAQTGDIDLIVMTTHGRTGLGRLLFGSVAESVLRRATVPALLIRTVESE